MTYNLQNIPTYNLYIYKLQVRLITYNYQTYNVKLYSITRLKIISSLRNLSNKMMGSKLLYVFWFLQEQILCYYYLAESLNKFPKIPTIREVVLKLNNIFETF